MAYGLNFFSEWKDNDEVLYRTEILRRDYSGVVKEVTSGGNPFVISLMDDASSDVFYSVRTQKAEIEWISDDVSGFNISDIFITDEQEYKVVFSRLDGEISQILWQGFLTFTDCKEPFQARPYPVKMTARCGLSLLRDIYFLDAEGRFVEGTRTLISIISRCLSQTKLDLEIDTHIGLIEEGGGTPSFLENIDFNTDGLRGKKAFEALEGILNSVDAFITQTYGSWTIRGLREQQANTIPVRRYSASGAFIGANTAQQAKSIGSEALAEQNPEYVNIQPMADVVESLADPFSIITNNVSPGIPMNLLGNGTFNPNGIPWGVNLNNLTGWAHSPEPKGWRIEGDGKPDDPYRFVIIGSVKTTNDIVYDSKNNNSAIQAYTAISNVNPITIFRDGGVDSYPNIKLVVSGAFKMRDGGRLMISCRLNDGDKENITWMDETGSWKKEKKFIKRVNIKVEGDTQHNPEKYIELQDIPLQTFEFKSDKINNYLNRPGGWIARLYFSVYPVAVGVNSFPEVTNNFSPAISLEDFSVSITTETAYEQDHTYEIDAKKVISNGEKYEYDTIIADKINILTAHQKRDLHRVMTGYLTVGSLRLTKAWKRIVDGSPVGEFLPLQHLTLTERVRELCGKRRVLEGSFYADIVSPTDSIRNLFDPEDESFYTITGWSWDVKNKIYQLRIHELDFTPLPEEVIKLTDKQNNGRGNRLYTGAGGSSSSGSGSNSGSDVGEEILLNEPEPYEYEVLVEDEEKRVCDIGALLESDHSPDLLEAKILSFPPWISEISLYRGEDLDPEDLPEGGILNVLWKGKPEKSGTYQILVELVASDGADYILSIPLVVEPSEDFIESWPPVFVDLPTLIFEKGIESTQVYDIFDYLDPEGDHTGVGLSPKLLSKPNWITDSTIVFGLISATGKPLALGSELITYEISDVIGRTTNVPFPVKVVEPIKMVHELVGIGEIPGSYELPEEFQIQSAIEAEFDRWEATLKGGGSLGDGINESWTDVDPLPTFTADAGQFVYEITLYRLDVPIKTDAVSFVLYDEEYLTKVKAVVVKEGVDIAEINLDGRTNLLNPETANFVARIEDIEHDEAVLTLDVDERIYDEIAPEYAFYDQDTAVSEGEHTFTVTLKNEGLEVEKRTYRFTVGEPDVKPEGGLKLVTFAAGTTNYTEVAELPVKGGLFQLPPNYSILYEGDHPGTATWEYYKLTDGSFAPIVLENPERLLSTVSKILIFGNKNSTQITGAHDAPARFKVVLTVRDQSGEVSEILQSDFSFRIATLPGEGSGLDLHHTNTDGSNQPLIDSNIPKEGYTVEVPVAPMRWQIRFTHFPGGEEFDALKSYFIKNNTIFFKGINNDGVSSFEDRVYAEPVTEIPRLSTFGWSQPSGDYVGYMHPTGISSINEPGLYEFRVEGYLAGVKVAETYSKFNLVEATPEEPPIKDCCDCECEGGDGEWNLNEW